MRLISRALEGTQASEVLFLIDACRNDPSKGRGDSDASLSEEFARGLRPKLTAAAGPKPKLVATLLACDVGQRAWEDPEAAHGVFTVYLLKALSGKAAGADGQVRLSTLATYVEREVGAWATRAKKQQHPRLVNPDGGDMIVCTPPPEPVVSVAATNQPLAALVQSLAEQYGVQIVLAKNVDGTVPVSGRLDNMPLSAVLKVLLATYGLQARRDGQVYVIETRQAEPAPTTPVAKVTEAPQSADTIKFPVYNQGTLVVAQDGTARYRTIAEALSVARDGMRILIRRGTYKGSLEITKAIELVGEAGAEATSIQSTGERGAVVVYRNRLPITLRGVTLLGLQRSTSGARGNGLLVGAATCYLDGCTIRGPQTGIAFEAQGRLLAQRCLVEDCGRGGLLAGPGSEVTLLDCTFRRADEWLIASAGGARLVATRCELGDCPHGTGAGCASGSSATLTDCHIFGNTNCGASVMHTATLRLVGCRLNDNGFGVGAWPEDVPLYIYNTATRTWEENTHGIKPPPAGDREIAVLENCDLTGNSKGAFNIQPGLKLRHTGCKFDPDDKTVPKP